jgi:hypothetical protein
MCPAKMIQIILMVLGAIMKAVAVVVAPIVLAAYFTAAIAAEGVTAWKYRRQFCLSFANWCTGRTSGNCDRAWNRNTVMGGGIRCCGRRLPNA